MAGTFNILKPIYLKDTYANVDYLYGPYDSVASANAAIPMARRALGLTVAVIEEQGVVEYWYKAGVSDSDLVAKIAETVPKLEYTEEYPEGTVLRAEEGNSLTVSVKFTSQTYGQCTLSVYKDGVKVKTIRADKGIIPINLGVSPEGTYTYEITGVDALTIPANERLVFKAVVGGAKISTDFGDTLEGGINTSSDIAITYTASVADVTKTVKVYGELRGTNTVVSTYNATGSGNVPSRIEGGIWQLGVVPNPDSYTLTMYAYTGSNPQDTSGDNVVAVETYSFVLMNAGEFIMTSTLDSYSCDTNTAVSIPFRIYCGSRMQLQAHGVLLNSQGEAISNYTLNRTVMSNTLNYWSLGKISNEGNYTIRLWATTVGGESPTANVDIPTVVTPYEATYEIITSGLVAQFTADGKSNNNDADTAGVWRNSVQGSNIYFQLTDLNYNTNGWKHVDESIPDSEPAGEMMLKFTGDSFGRLKQMNGTAPSVSDPDYFPMNNLNSSASTGFTAEIIYRTRCIGELNAKVMTGHTGSGTNTAGFSASYNTVTVGADGSQVRLDASEDEWIHATMVVDKTIHTDVDDVQDYAPEKLMTIYINGSACAAAIITENMSFSNYGPVLLNAAFNTLYNKVDYFGACEIKAIRFYNRSLRASEVVNNYIASIYDAETQETIAGRNGDVLPIVRFININSEHPKNPMKADETLVDFATLNQMTEKSRQKKEYVCARILYQENSESEIVEWPRCTVQTQGTSTLAFPVKNYKIRFFADEDNPDGSNKYKTKLYTDKFADKGWQDEYVYTLKCDYMEAAHLNNTPSCEFYNEMIDTLVDDGTIATGWNSDHTVYTSANDQRTPSRREEKFDAIKGFPCLVYYYESENDYYANNGVYVGSYMFNLDKAAESLGFDAPATLDTDGETVIPVNNPRYTAGGDQPQTLSNICQSFEGVANGSDTAGCFYSYEDWKTSHYNAYLEYAFSLYNGPIDNLDDFVTYYLAHPSEQYRDPQQSATSSDYYDDGGYLMEKEAYITAEGKYANEYDYFASDFEMRYDWDDIEEGGEEYWGNSNWGLKRMIDWVSSASSTAGLEGANDVFRTEFANYFNLNYVLLYYLQMIVFGQVDNAGKNSMWDTWDGLHWYPRPYDLDTMAGLNNTGIEMINPDAELHPELSPYMNFNTTPLPAGYSTDISPVANLRYEAYNTRTSKFWLAFAKSFSTEIKAMYRKLRDNGVYSIEHIMEKFKSKTSDIIGEAYYNRDMATKFYKLSDITVYIDRMHGNRVQRFKAWMTDRIIFCDTLFDYTDDARSLNNNIFLRSDAFENNVPVSVSIGITTYSPGYVFIDVGSGYNAKIKAYCSPDSRYEYMGEIYEGTLFTLPIVAGNKEVFIYEAGNIKDITNFGGLKANSIVLNNAKKLISLDVSYSTKLLALSLSNNTYLQTLDARGSVQLGSDASGSQLDLSNCQNLKYAYLDNTKLQSVVFPIGGSLKEISMTNTAVTGINLDSLHFLTSVDVSGCNNLMSYSITNCPKIQTLEINNLPLTSVSITYCDELSSLSLEQDNAIANLYIASCPNINDLSFKNSRSQSMTTLDLTTLFSLQSLDISGSTAETIKFPKNESATSSVLWGSNFTTFNTAGSNIKYVQYGEEASTGVNMAQLTSLSSVSFNNCPEVEHISNLNYTGSCNSLFNGCSKLVDIQGSLTCNGSAYQLFNNCFLLSNISQLTVNFAGCTSLNRAFMKCHWITYAEIKRILDSCGTSLTNISEMCRDRGQGVTYPSGSTAYTTLPANFFGNCKYVTLANTSFWGSKLASIPANAFIDASGNPGFQRCTTATIMFGSTAITSIPTNIMQYYPSVTEANGMFLNCSQVTTTLPSTFFNQGTGTSTLTTIRGMFFGCSNLVVDMSSMGSLLAPLTNVTDVGLLFYGCTKCTGSVPEGFFANNTRLTTVAGCFMHSRISGIPATGSLFRIHGNTTAVMENLTTVSGLFESCSSLITNPNQDLFAGCSNVTTAGNSSIVIPSGGTITFNGVFYNCSGITAFDQGLFMTMPRLQDIGGFFRGCSSLVCQTGGGFNGAMLSSHTELTNVSHLFDGCTRLTVSTVPQMFTASKDKITNASYLFTNCTSISDYNSQLFTNMTRLTNVSYAFSGCTSLSTPAHSILPFAGCTALQNVAAFYNGCTGLSGSVPVGLFNSCRGTIQNTASMFSGCTGLDGTIGVGNEDTVSVDSPSSQLGLLAECVNLTNTSSMFRNCRGIHGQVPWDIFWTRSVATLYTQLTNMEYMFYATGFDTPTMVDDVNYMFHPNLLSRLIAVTTMEGLFSRSSSYPASWQNSYPVHANAFDGQYFLTNIKEIFHYCEGLGDAIPNRWFINSISSITNAYGAFAYTKITSVGPTFLRANAGATNVKLTTAGRMFYSCPTITSALPEMNNVALFSKINYSNADQGYLGYAYNCPNASNIENFTEPWKRNMNYY